MNDVGLNAWDGILSLAIFVILPMVHTITQPGLLQLVFALNIILNISHETDKQSNYMAERKEQQTNSPV